MSFNVELLEPHSPQLQVKSYGNKDTTEPTQWQMEGRYRSLVENAAVGIFQATVAGRFLMANSTLCRIYGYDSPPQLTDTVFHLKAQLYTDSNRHSQLVELLQKQPVVEKFESEIYRQDGSKIWICENVRGIWDRGEMIAYEGVVEDITERKQALNSLQEMAQQKEKQLGELRSHFVSMVSHEFRAALTVISAASSLLKLHSQKMTAEQRFKYFDKIAQVVKDTTEMIEGFLTISKAETGMIKLKPIPINLSVFCQEVWQDVQTVTKACSQLVFSETCSSNTVAADKTLLRQILLNLLLNAVKYSPEGSPVYLELATSSTEIVLRIKDVGIGIPSEDQQHLFELFHRAQNVSTSAGTGLGLAIVKRAVELHGGKIEVDSTLGVGTSFTVTLPVLPPGATFSSAP